LDTIQGTRDNHDRCAQSNTDIEMYSAISGIIVMKSFKQTFTTGYSDANGPGISPSQSGQIVSILSAGTFFGALGAAPFADHIGRRLSLILAVGVFTFGVILQVISSTIPLFLAGRYAILMRRMVVSTN
jgi:SP family sugar:H+ symporter-like MFS transporter